MRLFHIVTAANIKGGRVLANSSSIVMAHSQEAAMDYFIDQLDPLILDQNPQINVIEIQPDRIKTWYECVCQPSTGNVAS